MTHSPAPRLGSLTISRVYDLASAPGRRKDVSNFVDNPWTIHLVLIIFVFVLFDNIYSSKCYAIPEGTCLASNTYPYLSLGQYPLGIPPLLKEKSIQVYIALEACIRKVRVISLCELLNAAEPFTGSFNKPVHILIAYRTRASVLPKFFLPLLVIDPFIYSSSAIKWL